MEGLGHEADPDKTLAFIAEMDLEAPECAGAVVYACPMHPEAVSDEPGRCPQCTMKLLPVEAPNGYTCPMHPEVIADEPGHCPECRMKLLPAQLVAQAGGGHAHARQDHEQGTHEHSHAAADRIEWEDDIVEVNRMTTPTNRSGGLPVLARDAVWSLGRHRGGGSRRRLGPGHGPVISRERFDSYGRAR